jgi:hypothetical protein
MNESVPFSSCTNSQLPYVVVVIVVIVVSVAVNVGDDVLISFGVVSVGLTSSMNTCSMCLPLIITVPKNRDDSVFFGATCVSDVVVSFGNTIVRNSVVSPSKRLAPLSMQLKRPTKVRPSAIRTFIQRLVYVRSSSIAGVFRSSITNCVTGLFDAVDEDDCASSAAFVRLSSIVLSIAVDMIFKCVELPVDEVSEEMSEK